MTKKPPHTHEGRRDGSPGSDWDDILTQLEGNEPERKPIADKDSKKPGEKIIIKYGTNNSAPHDTLANSKTNMGIPYARADFTTLACYPETTVDDANSIAVRNSKSTSREHEH